MADDEWLEVPVFLHGITTARVPSPHGATYLGFLSLVNEALARLGKRPLSHAPIMVEWGWEASLADDKYLAEAERRVATAALPLTETNRRISLNPFRRLQESARHAFLFGFADMFYYLSADGERAVRENVFRHLSREIAGVRRRSARGRRRLSLTFIAHSAGAVIAHDFLYRLFGWGARPFLGLTLNKVRRLSRRGRLRIRRFYTMGAPITPFIFRSQALIEKILKGEKLRPEVIGLGPRDGLAPPRWLNFWDPSDVVSYPLAFLYDKVGGAAVVEDRRVDLGGGFPAVHARYWQSERIAEEVAANF